jgi:transglutaminase-like putative cysteine protease
MSYDIYTALLKMYDEFQEGSQGIVLSYDTADKNIQELRLKYALDEKAGNGDDLSKSINLLQWISENIYHNGDYNGSKIDNSIHFLDYAYRKGKDFGINCRALAITLTECLLSIGIKAHTLYLFPALPYDFDNHVITQAYIKETGQWVLLDPTFNCYIMNKENKILNAFEIRKLLADQEDIFFNKEINYNGDKYDLEEGKVYYAKNLFYFRTYDVNKFDAANKSNDVYICPKNYDIKKAQIYNIEFRIRKSGDLDYLKKWLEETRAAEYKYTTPFKLLKIFPQ